ATWNETAIQAATQMGNREIFDYLISKGALVDFFTGLVLGHIDDADGQLANSRGIHDLPALYFAAIGGHVDVARRLLAAGPEVNTQAQAAAPPHPPLMATTVPLVNLLPHHRPA